MESSSSKGMKPDAKASSLVIENASNAVDSKSDMKQKRRRKVKKIVEYIINRGDVELAISYEEDESYHFNEIMLEQQETFQRQFENFGYAFIPVTRELILTDDEDEEEGDPVSDYEEENDIFSDDDDDQ
uniref:Uncharacterized protein n=1 Tax=Leersia perrieri TaxID=77586 RepID=A0A0D9XUI7_9ORYZ